MKATITNLSVLTRRYLLTLMVVFRLVAFVGNVPMVMAADSLLLTSANPVQASQVVNAPVYSQPYTAADFIDLTNQARAEVGVSDLQINDQLNAAALAKAYDMAEKGYWDHFRPSDHKAPWDFISEAGYSYRVAGENLARGFRTPGGITRAWLASPTHRANLLSAKYQEVGFACIETTSDTGESVLLTVQMFGSR